MQNIHILKKNKEALLVGCHVFGNEVNPERTLSSYLVNIMQDKITTDRYVITLWQISNVREQY